MPNWVKNNVIVTGKKEALEQFKEKHFKEECLDFETIIPMPDKIFRGDLGQEEKEKYGDNNWYDWSIQNWGTKWNAGEGYLSDVQRIHTNTYMLQFEFTTAWSVPEQIYRKLSELYPDVGITVEFADEDIGSNCGTIEIGNGEIDICSLDGDEEFANSVWGWHEQVEE